MSAGGDENTEEELVYECAARYHKEVDGKWMACTNGILHIYHHHQSTKSCMVIRNVDGRAQFNEGISKGMSFEKCVCMTKKRNAGAC